MSNSNNKDIQKIQRAQRSQPVLNISGNSFKFNKTERDKFAAEGKKLRYITIALFVLSLAGIIAGIGFVRSTFGMAGSGSVYALRAGSLLFTLISAFIWLIPAIICTVQTKKDPMKGMYLMYAIKGDKAIAETEQRISDEVKIEREKAAAKHRSATKKKYRPKKKK